MSEKLIGKKVGMMQMFDQQGHAIPCTVIEIQPNVVTQVKTLEKDGYEAVQIAAVKNEKKKGQKPLKGHFTKAGLPFCEEVLEFKGVDASNFSLGEELTLEIFEASQYIDVIGVSKGKGFQGLMKKYNFSGGPAAHGSNFHRHAGSTGMRSTPGRCFPGGKRASQMGGDRKTIQNLKVIRIDKEKNLLIVKGAVPGPNGSKLVVQDAKKKFKAA